MKEDLNTTRGLDAVDVLGKIVRTHPQIEGIYFSEPRPAPSLQSRFDLSSSDGQILRKALDLRGEYDLPFWDGVMLSSFKSDRIPDKILTEATFHQTFKRNLCSVTPSETVLERIRKQLQQVPSDKMLAVCSEVRMKDGSTSHIPMMDFHCPVGPHSVGLVRRVVELFRVGEGFLLETDKSYHFYGMQLLEKTDLIKFLGRALLFSPIVDRAWIAHQLMELCCALRISCREGSERAPTVVESIR